jgi:hypothetical protein
VSANETEVTPSQEEFITAPLEMIAAVAPRSLLYAPGGTRRSAAFAGVEPWSKEYLRLGQDGIVRCLEVIFRHGVEHVFTPSIMVGHANEVENIEQQLIIPMGRFVTNPRLLQLCRERGWRMKIAPSAYHDVLQPFMEQLEKNSPENAKHTWWMSFTPNYESWWSTLFALAKSEQVTSRDDAIHALYGEEIPPITLCLSFGKPMISPDFIPPLLMDNVHCYWSQQAGYGLTDAQFRKVLYDYAYLRQTWQKDKALRAKEAQVQQEVWEQEVIVGLGKRLGPFWYPELSQLPSA